MTDDDLCTLVERELVMRIDSALILCKESRITHLADVVIEGSRTDQLGIGTDTCSRFGSQDRYLQRMLERTGTGLAEPFQGGCIDVGQFHQGDARHIAEGFFQHIDQDVGEGAENEIDTEIEQHHPVDLLEVSLLIEVQTQIGHRKGEEDEEGATDQLRTLAQLA